MKTRKERTKNQRSHSKFLREYTTVLTRDKQNKPRTLLVPGSDGKRYHVIIRRKITPLGHITLSGECRLDCGKAGFVACKGNLHFGRPCKHVQAAIDKCLLEAKFNSAWCFEYADTKINLALKGRVFTALSWGNKKSRAWVIATPQ